MRASILASGLGARVLAAPAESETEISRVYASDRMSDLLNQVEDHTLLVTHLSHALLGGPIELMDISALCFLNGVIPSPELMDVARRQGTTVLVSPYGMYETCGRLYEILDARPGKKVS